MRQENLDGLVAFVSVAESQGFSTAAARLGLTPSAVSQTIRLLEARVGVALFNRTTRSVRLTEAGERFLERVRPAVMELNEATDALGETDARPAGLLRLNMPRVAYMFVLHPILERFLAAYPDVSLEIAIDSSLVDIVGGGFDAGIRFNDIVERDMVGVRVGPPMAGCVVASPAYWRAHGKPENPRQLLQHDCIQFRLKSSGTLSRWDFVKGDEKLSLAVTGRLVFNDVAAILQSTLDGLGVAYMSSGYLERFLADGRLIGAVTDWWPELPGLTLYYPGRRSVSPKLRALIDFIRQANSTGGDLGAVVD
jgi:DNA-binding transcriptional LysR family regulator